MIIIILSQTSTAFKPKECQDLYLHRYQHGQTKLSKHEIFCLCLSMLKKTQRIFTGCEQYGYIETCQQSNERTVCNFNIWVPITMIFTLVSVAFVVSSSALIMKWKRTHKSTTFNNTLNENRCVSLSCPLFYIPNIFITKFDYTFFVLSHVILNWTQDSRNFDRYGFSCFFVCIF